MYPQHGEIDEYIQKLTGITMSDLAYAPTIKSALDLFVEWLPNDATMISWSRSDVR